MEQGKVIAKEYHHNGKLKFLYREVNRDDVDHMEIIVKRYYKSGQIKEEEGWFFGNMYGSEWYENGQIRLKYHSYNDPTTDVSEKKWNKNGVLIKCRTSSEEGSVLKEWNSKGKLIKDIMLSYE